MIEIDVKLNCLSCVSEIFDNIANTPGRLDKEAILKNNIDNQLFKECLKFLLDTYTVTGISKAKLNKKLNLNLDTCECDDIRQLMDYIKKNNTGRDSDIIVVQKFMRDNPELREFIFGLITKSTKLGLTSKTVNKIYKGFIREFSVMLAESYDKNEKRVGNKRFILTTKIDGSRMTCIKEDDTINFFSRQGQVIEGLYDIQADMSKLPDGVYDGELVAIGNFKDSKEQFSETMKRSRVKGIKTDLQYIVYDYIEDVNNFYNGIDKTPCEVRKDKLNEIIEENLYDSEFVEYLYPLYIGDDKSKIEYHSRIATEDNQEGIMLSIADSQYQCKRVKDLLKIKVMKSCDIRCIRVEEGQGRLKGTLGNIVCDYKGFLLSVGSGFDDKTRKEIWDNPNMIIGRVVEVQYFEELKTDGKLSVRFPVFLGIRDKDKEVSYH